MSTTHLKRPTVFLTSIVNVSCVLTLEDLRSPGVVEQKYSSVELFFGEVREVLDWRCTTKVDNVVGVLDVTHDSQALLAMWLAGPTTMLDAEVWC